MQHPTILITGGSSGIGLATAYRLSRKGWTVYALSRSGKPRATDSDDTTGIIHLQGDVNRIDTLHQAIEVILHEHGHLDAVVCNAGNGLAGAIEDTSDAEARYQFETTFFGVHNTITATLPHLRRQQHGRIIIVSSVAGIIPIPFQAFYAAAKAALLTYGKALNMETRPFGIQCSVILPGDTRTGFTTTRCTGQAAQSPESAYHQQLQRSIHKMEQDEQNGIPPQRIASAIARQLHKKRMKPVIVPCAQYKFFAVLVRLLPNKVLLRIVGLLYA